MGGLPRRKLGSTGLDVPVLGFGASPLGGIYNLVRPLCASSSAGWSQLKAEQRSVPLSGCCCGRSALSDLLASEQAALAQEVAVEHPRRAQKSADKDGIAAVHRAFELGLNYFDTAPHYGDGKSEQVLHLVLLSLWACAPSSAAGAAQPWARAGAGTGALHAAPGRVHPGLQDRALRCARL